MDVGFVQHGSSWLDGTESRAYGVSRSPLNPLFQRRLRRAAALAAVCALRFTAGADQVVLTEVMHDPPRGQPAWVEVWNQTATPFDIANWRLTGSIDFAFPDFNATNAGASFLRAFERIVVSSATPEAMRAAYTNLPPNARVFGPWTGRLLPAGDRLSLKDRNGVTVCTVQWSDRGRWSPAAKGTGHTLVLRDSNKRVDDWRNWSVSARPLGTPGFEPPPGTAETARSSAPGTNAAGTRLLEFTDSWRYWGAAAPVDSRWREANFNDAAWPQGAGLLGFAGVEIPAPGLRTRLQPGPLAYYFRRAFVFNGDTSKGQVTFDAFLDDGAVIHLNGREVARVRMPAGAVARDTPAEAGVGTAEEERGVFTVPASAFVRGANVLAVEVHQIGPQSSDIVFGLRATLDAATRATNAPIAMPSPAGLLGPVRLNELQFAPRGGVEWVELCNPSKQAVPLDGLFLASRADFADKVPLGGTLAAGACRSWAAPFYTRDNEITLFIVDAGGCVRDAETFVQPRAGRNVQAFPDGAKEWFAGDKPTRDATNHPSRQTDIVINELFFDPPYPHKKLGFIELYNRGRAPVNLGGWAFTEGVSFTFPRGAKLAPGAFLVVAQDASRLRGVHGNIEATGNFSGRLDHDGDLVRLVDDRGNLADEVDFRVGGDWPELTRGGGSSMELLHPALDNARASAWRDSDESAKSEWREFKCSGIYQQLRADGAPADFKELHFHLVGDAHIALRHIQLLKNGEGTNLLANAGRLSTNGTGANGWLAQGNHWASFATNGELHLVADGHGDNRPNRAELDCPAIERGQRYELRFEARWVSGTPRLIAQSWDHSLGDSFLIAPPMALGTPGRPNSRQLAAPPPQVDDLRHSPAVPKSRDAVKITARVAGAVPLAPGAVRLFHRADSDAGNLPWESKPMFDDGTNGDELADDGVFTAELTEHRANGRVVQFFVEAGEPAAGTRLPRRGAAWPAMFVVDDRAVPRDLRVARYVVSAYDYGAINNGASAKYAGRFPRLSNHYFNCTFIHDERDIFYGGEVRTAGSPWTRGGDLSRGKLKLPRDRPFRGHTKFTYDNDADGGNRFHNRITRYWLYLLGEPASENEFIRVVLNGWATLFREETEPVGNEFLDRIFPRGRNGDLYRIDDEWWFTDGWGQAPQDANWVYKGTDHAIRYRTEWMKRTNEAEDDFTALVGLFKLISDPKSTREQIERVLDPESLAKTIAVRGYIGDWDTFVMHRGKNGYFYRRPTDGRFMFLHWDSDLGFDANGSFWGGRVEWWVNKPWNRRLWAGYMVEMLDNYTKNSARFNAWLQAEEDASASFTVDANQYRNFAAVREGKALGALGPNARLAFSLATTNGVPIPNPPAPVSTHEESVTLRGVAPYGVVHVFVASRPTQRAEWPGDTAWILPRVALSPGENTFTIIGANQWGRTLRDLKVTVVRTNGIPGGR